MNITIEKFVPLVEISEQFQEGGVIRGNPTNIIESCLKLSWDNPARLWTFRTPEKPPFEKLEAFMDRFELVFKIHEGDGNYKAAWWSTSEEDSDEYIIKGLFADLNPETGPDFFKRAADGPRLAIWFGGIHKIMDANKTNTLPYRIRPFLSTGHLNPLHLCNEFHISHTCEQTEFLIENFEEFVELTRKAAPRRNENFNPDRPPLKANEKSVERILEHMLYQKFHDLDSIKSESASSVITHIPCYQFPLAAHGEAEISKGWGKVDLIGCTADNKPAIIELKRGDSKETPLRVIVEGLAYAIAVQEMWKEMDNTFRNEWNQMLGVDSEDIKETDLNEISIIGLAPREYWKRWNTDETGHSKLQEGTGAKISELIDYAAKLGFNIHLASYETNEKGEPISEIELITNDLCQRMR